MPTTLSTFATGEATMRYREPYVTDGLNKKMAVANPPGTLRGFRLGTSGAALSVTVQADATALDHAAVYQTQGGHSLTIRKTGGNFTLDLSAFVSKTVVVCLYATYGVGFTTTAEIRGYELAPSDTFTGAAENSELVVLGTVVVPAAGTIAAASITHARRRMSWEAAAVEAVPWSPVIKNPSFEHGISTDTTRFGITDWVNRNDIDVNGSFRINNTTVRSGAKSLEFNKTAVGASTGKMEQYQEVPVTPGQLVRVVGYVRQLIAPTGGSYTFNLYWGDLNSAASGSDAVTASAAGVDASFRKVEAIIVVPASKYVLKTVTIEVVGVTTGSTGVAVVFDDFQVFVEAGSALVRPGALSNSLRQQMMSAMVLEDPSTYQLGNLAALLRFDKALPGGTGEGAVVGERRDQLDDDVQPALSWYGRIVNLGARMMYSGEASAMPRIQAPFSGNDTFTQIFESGNEFGGGKKVRIYVGDIDTVIPNPPTNPGLFLTVNARYVGSGMGDQWVKDTNGVASAGLFLSPNTSGHLQYVTETSPNTWINSGWERNIITYLSGGGLNLDIQKQFGGFEKTLLNIAKIAFTGSATNPSDVFMTDDLGYQRRANVWSHGNGDVYGMSAIDPHGRYQLTGRCIEDDFEGLFASSKIFTKLDLSGVGSASNDFSSNVNIACAGALNNFTIISSATSYFETGGGSVDLGFRARFRPVTVVTANQYFGFWDDSTFNPDNDNALNGFKVVNGVVSVVWNDGSNHVVSTGVTMTGSEARWFNYYFDVVNGILQWWISTSGASFGDGYLGGTYGQQSVADITGGNPVRLFGGVKTTTASVRSCRFDYLAAYSNQRQFL